MEEADTVTDLLFRSKRIAVVHWLLQHPDQAFTVQELSDKTSVSYATVHGLINQLANFNIVTNREKGGYNLISLNQDSPYIPPLKEFFTLDNEPLASVAENYLSELQTELGTQLVTGVLHRSLHDTPSHTQQLHILLLVNPGDEEKTIAIEETAKNHADTYHETHNTRITPHIIEQDTFWNRVDDGDEELQRIAANGTLLHETTETRVEWYLDTAPGTEP